MSLILILFSVFVALGTWNLYHPVSRPPRLAIVSFLFGWLTGELALHHVAWQIILLFALIWGGALHGFIGATAFLLLATSWIAMAWFYFTGERAGAVMEQALLDGLGDDYRDEIRDEFKSRFPASPDRRRLVLPFASIDKGVEVLKDISFGNHGQKLDIYRPRRSLESSPVLLQIHGGAWTEKMGSKERQAIPLMTHMALRNWVCVSIDYRLSPKATFPEHLVDCKEGLAWVKQNIARYGGNPEFVIVTGGSAGGHLCALVALTANDPTYQPGFESEDTRVQGAVPFYGVYDFTHEHWIGPEDERDLMAGSVMKLSRREHAEAFRKASPIYQVNAAAPPFLVVHGDADSLVPVGEARRFVARLQDASNQPVAYGEIPGGQHAFEMFPSLRCEYTKQGVERFLVYCYSKYLADQAREDD